ncbi:MAG: hypothetical protein WA672_13840 [Candidatus Angelobacter sp.]
MTTMMRQTTGILCVATAILAGYWGSRAMFTISPDASLFWLPMIGFGAAILLLVGGVFTLRPKIKKKWFLAFVAVILATFWAVFLREFSAPYCIFVAALILVTWATLAWASASQRSALVAFIANVSLALFWLPMSLGLIHTTDFLASLASNSLMVALWLLIVAASVLSGLASFMPRRP